VETGDHLSGKLQLGWALISTSTPLVAGVETGDHLSGKRQLGWASISTSTPLVARVIYACRR